MGKISYQKEYMTNEQNKNIKKLESINIIIRLMNKNKNKKIIKKNIEKT